MYFPSPKKAPLRSGASVTAVTGTVNALPTVDAIANQTVTGGSQSTVVNFTGTGNNFTWTNNTPAIGLPASGTGTDKLSVSAAAGAEPGFYYIPLTLTFENAGSVEAIMPTEPWVSQIQDRGIGTIIAREGVDPNAQSQVLLYGEQFIRNNPEGARRFLLGYLRALRDLKRADYKDPGDAAIIGSAVAALPTCSLCNRC